MTVTSSLYNGLPRSLMDQPGGIIGMENQHNTGQLLDGNMAGNRQSKGNHQISRNSSTELPSKKSKLNFTSSMEESGSESSSEFDEQL